MRGSAGDATRGHVLARVRLLKGRVARLAETLGHPPVAGRQDPGRSLLEVANARLDEILREWRDDLDPPGGP